MDEVNANHAVDPAAVPAPPGLAPALPPAPASARGWSSMLGKVCTVVFGLLLLILGMAMLEPSTDGVAASGNHVALSSIISALGLGIIATVFLPHSLQVDGERFKPLGLNVKASGGAAVFIVVLAFLYFTNTPAAPAPAADDAVAEEEVAADQLAEADAPDAGVEDAAEPVGEEALVPDDMDAGGVAAAEATAQEGYYAETYCSDCCPTPDDCPYSGSGEGSTADLASQRAAAMCYQNGGGPTCETNVVVARTSEWGE